MSKATSPEGTAQESGTRGLWIYVIVASTIAGALAVFFLAQGKGFAFHDVGSDTFFCYYPLQLAVARQLQTLHEVTWSFELSLGGYLGTLFDPLWLISGWLPGSWQLSLRLPMFLLRLVLGGAFFYAFLRQFGFLVPVAVIGGLGYAFSSYGVLNTQWEVTNSIEFVQLAAYLFLVEHYLRNRRPWAGVAAGFVVGIGHPFALYMLALFGLLHATARMAMAPSGERKNVLASLAAFAAWCLPGLALSGPLLFPELYYLLESPRVLGGASLVQAIHDSMFSLNEASTIGAEIAGLVGKDLLGTGSHHNGWDNYFEGPGFYVGLLPLLCMPQLCGPYALRREKMALLICAVGCALYFIWPALRDAVYAFGLGHSAFRFSTLWVSVTLLGLGLAGLQRALVSGWWMPGCVAGIAGLLLVLVASSALTHRTLNAEHVVRVVAFTAVYGILALLAAGAHRKLGSRVYVLVAICACELLAFAIPAIIERDAVRMDGSSPAGRYDDGTGAALAYIHEHDRGEGFFRVEKTFTSVSLNDALAQGYDGTAAYYFHASSITRFVDRMGLPRPVTSSSYIGPMAGRKQVLDLLGVRYLLARNRDLDQASGMTYVTKVGDVHIYRNTDARPFATFYNSIGTEADVDALPQLQRDVRLLSSAIVEHPAEIDAALATMRAASAAPGLAQRTNLAHSRDDELGGEIETPSAALLLLSMPFDRGWRMWLDGANVDLFRADYGLTAALVPAGRHAIVLSYVPPGRQLGWAAMAGAIAFAGVFELFRLSERRRSLGTSWLRGFRPHVMAHRPSR